MPSSTDCSTCLDGDLLSIGCSTVMSSKRQPDRCDDTDVDERMVLVGSSTA